MEASDETDRGIGDPRAYLCATPMAVKQRDFSAGFLGLDGTFPVEDALTTGSWVGAAL